MIKKRLLIIERSTNVDAEPIDSDSDPDDLDLTTLDLNDPNSDHNEKYRLKSGFSGLIMIKNWI